MMCDLGKSDGRCSSLGYSDLNSLFPSLFLSLCLSPLYREQGLKSWAGSVQKAGGFPIEGLRSKVLEIA